MRGFTLIELVMTVGVAALLIGALATLFVLFSNLNHFELAGAGVGSDAGTTMRAIDAAVTSADHTLASHTFGTGTLSSSASRLVLELPAVDSTGAVISGTYDYVAVYLATTTAYERVETGSGSARRSGLFTLGSHVQSLAFTYDSADYSTVTTVTADLTASTTVKGQDVTLRLTQAMRMRNH